MKIKNLPPEICVLLAKAFDEKVDWQYFKPVFKWEGHDLIGPENDKGDCDVFQIYFSGKFLIYRNQTGYVETVSLNEKMWDVIVDYIKTTQNG